MSIHPYPNSLFRCIDNQDSEFGDSSIETWTLTRSGSPERIVTPGVAAFMSLRGFITAGTVNLAVPYFISLSQNLLAASPHLDCVILSCLISFRRTLSTQRCPLLEIVPITQPGSSSLLSLPSSMFYSSSSPSRSSSSSDLARSLVLATVLDRHFGCGSRLKPHRSQIGGLGCQ